MLVLGVGLGLGVRLGLGFGLGPVCDLIQHIQPETVTYPIPWSSLQKEHGT